MTDQKKPEDNQNDSEKKTLTPWQKENIIYMKKMEEAEETQTNDHEEPPVSEEVEEETIEEIESFVDKLPKVREQRHRVLRRRLSLIIGILGVAVIALTYYISPYSKLAGVAVSGNGQTPSEDIIDAADFQLHEDMWTQFFDKKTHLEQIKKRNPRVKEAVLKIKDLNHFQIGIKEYKVIAYGWINGQYHPLLENGLILNEIVEPSNQGLITFKNFKSKSDTLKQMLKFYSQLPEDLKGNVAEIQSNATDSNPYAVELKMRDGNTVFGNSTDLDKKIIYYPDVANDMKDQGVIHMEAGIYSEQPKKETEDSNAE